MADSFRIEQDSMGSIKVPTDVLWGAQTQRSLENFSISGDSMPHEIIHALALIKKAAAITNERLGKLNPTQKNLIIKAASQIAEGMHDNHFPLKVWQTGSGTQTNMNVNEVISNLACLECGEELGSNKPIHPNDDVNKSQSTNDIFPSAIHIAVTISLEKKLLPELQLLIESFDKKSKDWNGIIKIGRTHLQDAVPLTLGQEVSAWRDQVATAAKRIRSSLSELYPLAIGGTAVGTGLNAPPNFDIEIIKELSVLTGISFATANNKFAVMASHDGLVNAMSQLRMLAVSLLKIVNDIRLLASGPRAGFAELNLPQNEPGSSIMPGKVNPTQCEAMAMVCTQVIGLDAAVAIAGSGGHLQMNVYKPLIGFNLLQSIDLLTTACECCREKMIENMEPNHKNIQYHLDQSLMLVTALTPEIGYVNASKIAHHAYTNDISLRDAAMELDYINIDKFDQIINPSKMV